MDKDMSDKNIARIARNLALALSTFALERRPEDSKRVAELQSELCSAWRVEQVEDRNAE